MNRFYHVAIIVMAFVQCSLVFAEEYSGYDDIVRELRGNTVNTSVGGSSDAGFDAVRIHGGISAVTSRLNLDVRGAIPQTPTLQGAEAFFGIDLFSPNWIAEGSVRSFNHERYVDTYLKLKEFDLKIVYRINVSGALYSRFGAGMSARYLDFDHAPNGISRRSYTTPASILMFGMGAQLAPGFSIGLDFSYRTAMIDDTIDESALDGALRLTGSF